MPKDSDPLIDNSTRPSSIVDILFDGLSKINYKVGIAIFIFYIVLSSDAFLRVLSRVTGAVHQKNMTNWGYTITGLILVLFYIIVDILSRMSGSTNC
jgi:hypothetical protein